VSQRIERDTIFAEQFDVCIKIPKNNSIIRTEIILAVHREVNEPAKDRVNCSVKITAVLEVSVALTLTSHSELSRAWHFDGSGSVASYGSEVVSESRATNHITFQFLPCSQ